MIKITNGVNTILVPNGAYEAQFKPIGWRPVGSEKAATVPSSSEEPVKESEKKVLKPEKEKAVKLSAEPSQAVENELAEKPISEMTSKELLKKAKSLGIDTSGMSSKQQVRAAIAEVINK